MHKIDALSPTTKLGIRDRHVCAPGRRAHYNTEVCTRHGRANDKGLLSRQRLSITIELLVHDRGVLSR